MRYVTHQFAHYETLDRARRWLGDAGVSPYRMQSRHHGIPTLAVAAEPGEVPGIEMVIHAAEMADPDGLPSFWDLAHMEVAHPAAVEPLEPARPLGKPASFVLHWQPAESSPDGATADAEVELQRAYRERWD